MHLKEVEFLSSVSSFKRDVKKRVLKTPDNVLEALDGLRDEAESLGNVALRDQWRDLYRKFSAVKHTSKKSHAMRWARVRFNPHLAVSTEEQEVLTKEVKRYSKMDSSSSSSDGSSSEDEKSLRSQIRALKEENRRYRSSKQLRRD